MSTWDNIITRKLRIVSGGGCCEHSINPLNAELNPICYLLALLELTIFSTLAG